MLHKELTSKIISVIFEVHNELGFGHAEKCYERAMMIEFGKRGIFAESQVAIKVYYKGEKVGDFIADIIIDKLVILEIKAVSELIDEHRAQTLNYLKSTEIEVALLINFGAKSAQYERILFTNDRKKLSNNNLL
jgi:GxxExxY protein